jgi:hypothetical protein
MAMNTIYFQPSISLSELFEQYGTEPQCEQKLWSRYVGQRTSTAQTAALHYHFCRIRTSLRSRTIFHGSKRGLRAWFQTMFLISWSKNSIPALESYRQPVMSYPAVRRIRHKL